MKKLFLLLTIAIGFVSCSSETEDAISQAIFQEFKEDAMKSDSYTHTEIMDMEITEKEELENGDIKYRVDLSY